MRFSVYQLSRKGGREKNEDRMGYCYTRETGLFALADGMGGHPEGEVAAQLALQTLAARFQREAQPRLQDPVRFLLDGIQAGHQEVLRHAAEQGLADTPRTTVVACVLQDDAAYWAHCGDSRLYLVRGSQLVARTRDHSYSELQLSLGAAAGKAADLPVNRNVLFTCVGSPGKPVVDTVGPVAVQAGDRVMLCSDGLWGTLPDEFIVDILVKRDIADGVPELVESALLAGGERCDNVTVLAVEWEAAGDAGAGGAVSTHGLDDDSFASTIQASMAGEGADALDEAEIERSIREINDAIQRSAGRRGGPSSPR